MNIDKQKAYMNWLQELYSNFNNSADSTTALIALLAKEHDDYEEKIMNIENYYKSLVDEYKGAVAMWKSQAEAALELLKAQCEANANHKKQLTD